MTSVLLLLQEYEEAVAPLKQQLFQQFFQVAQATKAAGAADSILPSKKTLIAGAPLTLLEVGIGTGGGWVEHA